MTRHRKVVCLVLSACFIAATSILTFAQDGSSTGKCTFQTFNGPPASSSSPNALSDIGAVVGTRLTSTRHVGGYLLYQGKLTTFMFPGSADTFPHDINRTGTIVGAFDKSPGTTLHAFMVHSGGFHEIKIPGFPNAPANATGVNDFGDVAGQFTEGNGAKLGFLLHQGKLTILSFPGAKGGTFPTGLNNQGVIVGTYLLFPDDIPHGFMWKAGVFSNVSPLGADHSAQVRKVSNAGDIVGDYVDDKGVGHGFSFDKGKYTTIDVPNSLGTAIFAVNSSDQVIGAAAQQQVNTERLVKGSCSSVF